MVQLLHEAMQASQAALKSQATASPDLEAARKKALVKRQKAEAALEYLQAEEEAEATSEAATKLQAMVRRTSAHCYELWQRRHVPP